MSHVSPRVRQGLRWLAHSRAPFVVYLIAAGSSAAFLNARTALIPKLGTWYPADPFVELQVRAFLQGRVAVFPHPSGAWWDASWGRGGVHQPWGLGVPLLSTPFYAAARLFGQPAFPQLLLFFLFYIVTTTLLIRAFHLLVTRFDTPLVGLPSLVSSTLVGSAAMLLPSFVGLVRARFLIFEQTIAMGALFALALLAGTAILFSRPSRAQLIAVCLGAGFAISVRPTLAVYGFTTFALALVVAHRASLSRHTLAAGATAFAASFSIYLAGNLVRFGSIFNTGYANNLSGTMMNRLMRWGLPFAHAPLGTAARELFETMFFLGPLSTRTYDPPPSVKPFAILDRYREYYTPTFDAPTLVVIVAALAVTAYAAYRTVRVDRRFEPTALLGLWGAAPFAALFLFYTRLSESCTRFEVDFYPAVVALGLAALLALLETLESRPSYARIAEGVVAAVSAVYVVVPRQGVAGMSRAIDQRADVAKVAGYEATAASIVPTADHFDSAAPRGTPPMFSHLDTWRPDGTFESGMAFALKASPCVSLTFTPRTRRFSTRENEALEGLLANADGDALERCSGDSGAGNQSRVTFCERSSPPYLLDGMRLYAVASLDKDRKPIDGARLTRIEATDRCP